MLVDARVEEAVHAVFAGQSLVAVAGVAAEARVQRLVAGGRVVSVGGGRVALDAGVLAGVTGEQA